MQEAEINFKGIFTSTTVLNVFLTVRHELTIH